MTHEHFLGLVKPIWAEQLRHRQQKHAQNARAIHQRCAAGGIARSGTHILESFESAVFETRARARDAREVILRAISQTHTHWTSSQLNAIYIDLITNMNKDIDDQFKHVLHLVGMKGGGFNSKVLDLAHEEVAAIRKEIAELELVAAAPYFAPQPSNGVVVHGSVFGAVQTGSGATANVQVTIDSGAAAVLVDAIRTLRESLQTEPPSDLPSYADAVFADIEIEASKSRPEPKRIAALLAAGASIIETMANAPGAWQTVRSAAHAIGLPVP